jgi:glycosyltransferase involved in cell wall biosynthesis
VINEAAAAGLAIIATEITGAAVELVRHNVNGMLVAPGRRADLERAMLRVADPATLARMRQSSPRILADWRLAADPVDGLREAVEHFRQAAR